MGNREALRAKRHWVALKETSEGVFRFHSKKFPDVVVLLEWNGGTAWINRRTGELMVVPMVFPAISITSRSSHG